MGYYLGENIEMLKYFLQFVILLISLNAWAKKEMFIIGGGGEPAGKTTIFDTGLISLGKYAKSSGWSPTVVYNGGHHLSEVAAKEISAKSSSATLENINQQIAVIKQKLLKGELHQGDQLMIAITTHGAEKNNGEQTHSVMTIGDKDFSMDRLKEIRDLAEQKGVQLAIVDDSCHSGYSISLGTNKTCVVSTASRGFGYSPESERFFSSLKPGLNLEEAFLSSRNFRDGPVTLSAPQISTEAGRKAFEATDFLFNSLPTNLDIFKGRKIPTTACDPKSTPYVKLAKQMEEIEKSQFTTARYLLGLAKASDSQNQLDEAIQGYQKERQEAKATLDKIKKLNAQICIEFLDVKRKRTVKECKTRDSYVQLYAQMGQYLQATEADKIKEIALSPESKALDEAQMAYMDHYGKIYSQLLRIAQAERKVYKTLYFHYLKDSKSPNPCRDFKL